MLLQRVGAVVNRVECIFYLAGHHVGKESQTPHVHADDGCAFRPYAAGSFQEGSVAPHRHHVVHVEVVFVEHPRSLHRQMLVASDELVERTFHVNLCLPLSQIRQYLLYGSRFLGLELVAKKGETQFLLLLLHIPHVMLCLAKIMKTDCRTKLIPLFFPKTPQ